MKTEITLPRRTLYLWQLRLFFPAVLLIVLFFGLCRITLWMLIPAVLFTAVSILFMFWYLPLFVKSYRISAEKDAFKVKKGVFLETTYIMPYPRLVYVSTFSSPVSRLLRLKGAAMRAARGIILLPEMENSDIERISELAAGECYG